MAAQYQHYVQRAYLERWNVGSGLFVYDKQTGKFTQKSAAKNILGLQNMQTPEMETAFAAIETCIGHTLHPGEIVKPEAIARFAEWMALHLVRNALNAPILQARDYRPDVLRLSRQLASHYGFWMDFDGDVFITGDNPVVPIIAGKETFFIAALSPRRCVYLISEDKVPGEGGKQGLMPPTINRHIHNAATRFCVSFDNALHI